jgi:erythronate-4-phosphate dehydrogenase
MVAVAINFTRLKAQPELFEELRGNYPLRREEKAYIIKIE